MRTIKLLIVLMLLASSFVFSLFAQATDLTVRELSKGADLILSGKVIDQNSKWNENKSRIYTYVTIKVDEYLKGNVRDESVLVKYPGGEVGDVGEFYTHMPSFKVDEEVILFLSAAESQKEFKVYQGESGKINITDKKNEISEKRIKTLKQEIKKHIE